MVEHRSGDRSPDSHRRLARRRRTGPAVPDAGAPWAKGAEGEERVGRMLDTLAAEGKVAVLHDRRIPRLRANVDHLVVAPTGVWVVDSKHYRGRVAVVDAGAADDAGAAGGEAVAGGDPAPPRLTVDGCDRTKLAAGVRGQAEHVARALQPAYRDVPIHPTLCFVDAKRRLGSAAREVDGVLVTWERDLARRLRAPGRLDGPWRTAIQRHLSTRFRRT
jgi:hypothetical protein